jgi:hypothetical protein
MSTTPNTSDGKHKNPSPPAPIRENIDILPGQVSFRPVGKITLPDAISLITRAIKFTRDRQCPKLLVNALGLTGYAMPTLSDRYFAGRTWAAAAEKVVSAVLVIPPEMIDPEKFGVIVARNAGMNAEVFSTEAEAQRWLTSQPPT